MCINWNWAVTHYHLYYCLLGGMQVSSTRPLSLTALRTPVHWQKELQLVQRGNSLLMGCQLWDYSTYMATLRDDYSTLHSNNYIAGTWCSSIGTTRWRTNLENSQGLLKCLLGRSSQDDWLLCSLMLLHTHRCSSIRVVLFYLSTQQLVQLCWWVTDFGTTQSFTLETTTTAGTWTWLD